MPYYFERFGWLSHSRVSFITMSCGILKLASNSASTVSIMRSSSGVRMYTSSETAVLNMTVFVVIVLIFPFLLFAEFFELIYSVAKLFDLEL